MKKILAVAVKELRQARRDPLTLVMLLGVPTFMLLLYGYALNYDVRHVRLAVQDRSRSVESRDLVASLVNSTYFDLVADLPPGADLDRILERRTAKAILVVPEDYARDLAAGRTSPVQLLLDGTDAVTAQTALGYAAALVAGRNVTLRAWTPGGPADGPPPELIDEPRVLYNPDLESTQFLVPGLIGFILMITAVLSTALSVVREKERGTMEQLRVTALRPVQLLLGKTLPYLGISLLATAVILAAARWLFGVQIRGPHLHLFAATLIYLLGALGYGLLVSSLSDTQAMAFQIGTITSMLPAIFLSGFIFPIASMPAVLRLVTYAVPARYFLVILRGIILKGAGLESYGRDLLFLILYGAAVLSLAYARLTRREG